MPRFQRARKPEEKQVRRDAILGAARKLLGELGPAAFSLSELARRARVSKPNVYRYFESREAVLLEVWVEEVRALIDRLERATTRKALGGERELVGAIVRAFVAQPALCELTAISSAILERNVSTATIVANKRTLLELIGRVGELLHARLPAISLPDCAWIARATAIYVAGLWPASNPGEAAEAAYAEPGLGELRLRFEEELTRFLTALLAGLPRARRS